MKTITAQEYKNVLNNILVGLEGSNYCTLIYGDEDFKAILSVIVYRNEKGAIVDMVPTWWEYHTYKNGREVMNDFSFSEVRNLVHQF